MGGKALAQPGARTLCFGKYCPINAIVSGNAGFSPYFGGVHWSEMVPDACTVTPFGRTVDVEFPTRFQEKV